MYIWNLVGKSACAWWWDIAVSKRKFTARPKCGSVIAAQNLLTGTINYDLKLVNTYNDTCMRAIMLVKTHHMYYLYLFIWICAHNICHMSIYSTGEAFWNHCRLIIPRFATFVKLWWIMENWVILGDVRMGLAEDPRKVWAIDYKCSK